MLTIGQKIMECRENFNMSQEELAMRIRKSLKMVQQLEENQMTPDQDTLFNLSSVLDIPISDPIDCCNEQKILH
ncbi:helix-turn-helix domain-containing protein [Caldibacillus thermoamylovorans]|uniref:helix-turn-helix domain-containing protein n=1 Tax=Caldibacillus thermoamylovorans TaxID=35841 RepID=UPI00203F98C6|nr:helix-turn-helix transcriptional regulator [Caldibacillus thermoamylovorans]MCM3055607.1 helix-turn-helix domain-containing protein [Caldibacillus thermoamylovorans]